MRDAPLLDLIEARTRRDEGMAATLAAQDAEWRDAYRDQVADFLGTREAGDTFIGEALRVFVVRRGLAAPRHHNAWSAMAGSVLRDWLKAGLIVRDGMASARSVATHAHQCVRYRVVGHG